jgi:hypothetical protein
MYEYIKPTVTQLTGKEKQNTVLTIETTFPNIQVKVLYAVLSDCEAGSPAWEVGNRD